MSSLHPHARFAEEGVTPPVEKVDDPMGGGGTPLPSGAQTPNPIPFSR